MAVIMDTTYQLIALRALQLVQVLVVAVACAIVPYLLVRGPVTFLARRLHRKAGEMMSLLRRYLPFLDWGATYTSKTLANDLTAALIVTIMLIPQSLAYALLVGLPPQVGLYASMAPLVLYAIFGTSRALAVGPVAVASLMTAAAAGQIATQGTPEYLAATVALALVTGLLLLAMGVLRLGFLANFLSHPVISGFITASAIQIAAGQVAPLLGISSKGENLLDILKSMVPNLGNINPYTAAIGFATIAFLFWVRRYLKPLLTGLGLGERAADFLAKVGPAVALVATTTAVWGFGLDAHGVSIVGKVPQGLPELALPPFDAALWKSLLVSAPLLCIVSYVESISVALTLAAKRRQRVDPDQELIALGASQTSARPSPARFPVTGALSRSVVNFEAGAQTPAAGAFTAVGVAHRHAVSHAAAVLPAEGGARRHHHRRGPVAGGLRRAQAHLGLFPGRFRGDGRHDPRDVGGRRRGGAGGGRGALDLPAPLQHLEAARGGRGPDSRDRAFPQREPPRRGDRPRNPVAPGGREPLLPERPLPRGTCQRGGRGQPGGPPRHPRVPGGERDRRLGAREPRGDQPPAQGRRDHVPPVRGEGPGHGPPEAVALPRRS